MAVPAAARAVLTLLVLVLATAVATASDNGDGGSWCAFHPNSQPGGCYVVGHTGAARCGRC